MKPVFSCTPLVLLAFATNLYAAESKHQHEEEMEQHGSHEHGSARMTMAVTDAGLEISLESPAVNLFGFEHKASTDEQQEIVHQTVEKLEAGGALFIANAEADCRFSGAVIESAIIADHDEEAGHDHAAEKVHDDHDEHKGDKDHDGHDHDKDKKGHEDHEDDHDDHKDQSSHSDVDVIWTFMCDKPGALSTVETLLFSQFPQGFAALDVEWITANAAGVVELKEDATIQFSQ